jgi:carbonic anhydrase/acetyltransferase-like protein (isoleucine patch superfamily)
LLVPIYALGDYEPDIHPSAYVHPDAVVIGRVNIGAEPATIKRTGVPADAVEGSVKTYIESARIHRAGLRRLDR